LGSDFRLVFAVPLDFPMFATLDVLASAHAIPLKPHNATLQFPAMPDMREDNQGPLKPPADAVERLAHHIETWGSVRMNGRELIAEVEAVVLFVDELSQVDWDLSYDQVSGHVIDLVRNQIHDWLDAFISWVWVLTSQSLDANQPDPKFIHRKRTTSFTSPSQGAPPHSPRVALLRSSSRRGARTNSASVLRTQGSWRSRFSARVPLLHR
jgi:hypothetical protein